MAQRNQVIIALWLSIAVAGLSGCAPEAKPKPAPKPHPVVLTTEPVSTEGPDEWNIFPDPTTGQVEVYHHGTYVGSITGDEPEDPPIPRRRVEQR